MKQILDIKLYTIKELAELLGVTDESVRKYVKEGKMVAQMIGRKMYVSEESLRNFVLNK